MRKLLLGAITILILACSENKENEYKRQNKLFHFQKTFCSRFTFINTKQNVHFTTKK